MLTAAMPDLSDVGFENVDSAPDPAGLVSYLDAVTALDAGRAFKRRTFELMHLKPGHIALDVGCGAGDDLRVLAELVGPGGRAIGVDSSETMVSVARNRTAGLSVECHVADAHHLDFANELFDACRTERVLQHVVNPLGVLAEMVRVTRVGGYVVAAEPDWDTLVVDAADAALTRRILTFRSDLIRHPWIGRRLRAYALQCGLADVDLLLVPVQFTNWDEAASLLSLRRAAEEASAAGAATPAETRVWLDDLDQRAAAGRFVCAMLAFIVTGRRV